MSHASMELDSLEAEYSKCAEGWKATLVTPWGSAFDRSCLMSGHEAIVVSYRPIVPANEPAARRPEWSGLKARVEMMPAK